MEAKGREHFNKDGWPTMLNTMEIAKTVYLIGDTDK